MIEIKDKNKCCGCGACLNICPQNCIRMEKDEEGFLYPSVDFSKCINCGFCEKVCPFEKDEPKRTKKPNAYAVKIRNDKTREESSSGGFFSLIAEFVLSNSGVIYGVAMDDDCRACRQVRVDDLSDLDKLRGSKYFQATAGWIYKQVREDLMNGKQVLFSGVPCQIDALRLFLRKDYDNLLTAEVICHGVPSQALWEKYVEYLEAKYNAKVEKVNFRSKKHGWKTFGLTEEGDSISQYLPISKDPYMQMFLRNYCLRPACYDCNAKKLESMSDFTIADLWGIQKIIPEMDDDKGVSLVLPQTEKGTKLLVEITKEMIIQEINFDSAIRFNPPYHISCTRPKERDNFFIDMNSMSFPELEKKYCKPIRMTFFKRGLQFANRVAKKILHRN